MLFETLRLYAVCFNKNDFQLLFDLHNSEAVCKTTADGYQSEEVIKNHLEHFIDCQNRKGYSQWKFYEKKSNEFVGRGGIDYKQFDKDSPPLPELRFALHERFWGKGYATEIAQASLKFGFNEIKLPQIVGTCYNSNKASLKIFEKFEFKNIKNINYKNAICPYFILKSCDWSNN